MTTHDSERKTAPVVWTLDDVLPQKPPMVLLDAIVAHEPDSTTCSVRIDPASYFAAADGSLPSWVALEFMAQCAAAHSGICELNKGNPIRLGFLLGSRRLALHVPTFFAGQELLVHAHVVWDDGELASFECNVRDQKSDATLADCELSAYSPHNIKDLLEKQRS